MRPLQRAYFSCCHACTDDFRPSKEVGPCVQRCVEPVARINGELEGMQQAFQQRMSRCHELAGEAVPREPSGDGRGGKGPSPEAIAAYVSRLKPCVEEELQKLPALVSPVRDAIPGALEDVKRIGLGGGSGPTKGLIVGDGQKKGWW